MFKSDFYQQLKLLSPEQHTLFILALTQRASPNYLLFCEHSGFGNGQKFTGFIDLVWQKMLDPSIKINFELQQEKFEPLIPDIADFDMYGVYPALDSCVLLSTLFNQITSPAVEEAENSSRTSLGSVLNLLELQYDEEPFSDGELLQTELFQQEQKFQQQLLTKLQQHSITRDFIKALRQFSNNNGISNIGISLSE